MIAPDCTNQEHRLRFPSRFLKMISQDDTKPKVEKKNEKKMFFTTSDLMTIMNESSKGNFELQRRMPDGSTKRADESDMAVANFQSKMKQVCL